MGKIREGFRGFQGLKFPARNLFPLQLLGLISRQEKAPHQKDRFEFVCFPAAAFLSLSLDIYSNAPSGLSLPPEL